MLAAIPIRAIRPIELKQDAVDVHVVDLPDEQDTTRTASLVEELKTSLSITVTELETGEALINVGIIGAGIAGLTTAIALLEAGHDVELYERSHFTKEIGAAIHITPNAARILEQYHFDYAAAHGSELTELAYINGATIAMEDLMLLPDNRKVYGAPWQFYHRADLHAGLMKLVLEGRPGRTTTGRIQLGAKVIDVNEDGTISFVDGTKVKKDLVVIANGINCDLVSTVAGVPAVNVPTGLAMVRFLIPIEIVQQDPATKDFLNKDITRFVSATHGRKTFVAYPCKSATMLNCCVFHGDTIDWEENESSRPVSKEYLAGVVSDFHQVIRSICSKAEELSIWRLRTRPDPTKILSKGRLALLGDAAHPMLPFLGQGGALAVEDAATLGTLMSHGATADDVPRRLALYQQLRADRSCAMQILSNWLIDGLDTVFKQAEPFMDGVKLTNRGELNDWCYKLDAIAQAEEALKQAQLI